MEITTTLKVTGWHCGGCSGRTAKLLEKVNGVRAVTADLEKGEARVTYDDAKVSVDQLEKVITGAGYSVAK